VRYSLQSVADAAANLDNLTEPVDPVLDDGSAATVVIVAVVTLVPVGTDVDAARTNAELHGIRGCRRSRSQSDQRGERKDTSLHWHLLLKVTEHQANDWRADWFRENWKTQQAAVPL